MPNESSASSTAWSYELTVLGGGSFGTVLANIAAGNGHRTLQWLRDEKVARTINEQHCNEHYLPGCQLDASLHATTRLEDAVRSSPVILISVPSSALSGLMERIAPLLQPQHMLVTTVKGIIADGFRLPSQVIEAYCDNPVAVLSGPNLAKEIARKTLTATVIASRDSKVTAKVQELLANDYFRVYAGIDVYGVELGGALKNVYAIIAGLSAQLGMGENTRSMLITRALAEMSRFAVRLGADPMTFIGLSGVGDLIVTCTSPLSRNYRVGQALGQGLTLEEAAGRLGEVAEGINTLKLVKFKADELGVYMPLVQGLYAVVFEGLSIDQAIKILMQSQQRSDVEFQFSDTQIEGVAHE